MGSRNLEESRINALIILDVIGRPPEHLVETLENLIESMGKEKGVVVVSKKVKEPTLLKDQKEFFTTFGEVEVEVDETLNLLLLMFKYMPAHVEIISPENLTLSNNDLGDVLNELLRRLHGYDEIARVIQIENQKLQNNVKELEQKIEKSPKESTKNENNPEEEKESSNNSKKN